MNLKDAYRYSKFLDGTINKLNRHFAYRENFIQTTETHKKKSSDNTAQDEEIASKTEKTFEGNINSLIKAIEALITEKAVLASKIDDAKANTKVNWSEDGNLLSLDSAINVNKSYRDIADAITSIKDIKNRNYTKQGVDYRINNEGNQTMYRYTIEAVDTIDFDRDFAISKYKSLLTKADKISSAIEEVMSSDIVKFAPQFTLYDTDKDILAKYVS